MNHLGMPIIGLDALTPEYADLPLQWMPHIQAADVAAGVERGVEGGGRVRMHAKDSDGRGQWAGLLDPSGAAFGMISAIPAEAMRRTKPKPPEATSQLGRIAWMDLTAARPSAARDFHPHVVGWSVENVEMAAGGGGRRRRIRGPKHARRGWNRGCQCLPFPRCERGFAACLDHPPAGERGGLG